MPTRNYLNVERLPAAFNIVMFYLYSRRASRVILAFNTFDTGQPALAASAAFSNAAESAPGILARTSR